MKITTITNDNSYSAFPSVTKLPDGRLATLYHKGTNHVSTDAKMYCKIGASDGNYWSSETLVAADPVNSEQGGSILALRDGTLLSFTWQLSVTSASVFQSVGPGYCRRSTDGGKTWSSPVTIGGCSGYTSMQATGLELPDGTILLPVFGQDPSVIKCKVMQSVDKGLTWTVRGVIDQTQSLVEVCLLELSPGTPNGPLLASLRNQGTGKISFSRSSDGGRTWSLATDLFPGASTCPMITLPNGDILCCYRSMSTLNYSQMAFRLSKDGGLTWGDESVYLDSGQDGFEYAEFVKLDNGKIGLVFSHQSGTDKAGIKILTADPEEFGVQPTGNFQGLNVLNGDVRISNGNLWMLNSNTNMHYIGCLTNGYVPGEIRIGGASPGWCAQVVLYGRSHPSLPGSLALNPTEGGKIYLNGPVQPQATLLLPTYTDNANAKANGLALDKPYKTPAGDVKIVV